MKFIAKNSWWQHSINWLTYRLTIMSNTLDKNVQTHTDTEISPLWITGFFRSGTSLTTQIVEVLGHDLGPSDHLLKSKGQRASWNPNGFSENYIFMDWSLIVFEETGAWGHLPPTQDQLAQFDINRHTSKQFIYKSIVEIHDDRISNKNKFKALKKYSNRNLDKYLRQEFGVKLAIKNPHFSVLHPILKRQWPKSRFLVVFRNPSAAIDSAKKIIPTANYDLYLKYYKPILEDQTIQKIYFSYDHLMANSRNSLEALAKEINAGGTKIDEALNLLDPRLNRHKTNTNKSDWPKETGALYEQMLRLAINA